MLKEIRYNVLIVSTNEKVNTAITKYLSVCNCEKIDVVDSIPLSKRLLLEREYDIVVINSPVNDDNGINYAISLSDNERLGVLLLVRGELYDEAYDKTHEFGIMTLAKPTPAKLFAQSVRLLMSAKAKMGSIKATASSPMTLKQKMDEIKIVSDAKLLLMENESMSEEVAHRYIEKRAMDLRVTKRSVAEEVISRYHKG